jgi:pimeloyl-ACP methyl ester carboxylesterase
MPTVTTNGIETYYEHRGDGPPVVFVHGAIVDHGQWEPQLDALADEFTVVAYDVRGHGRTGGSACEGDTTAREGDTTARENYTMDLFADDLAALLTELRLDRPVICGLSMGGCIAQVFAVRYPERLSGLVLADTFTPEFVSRREWLQRSLLLRATIPFVRLFGYQRVEKALVWIQERLHGEKVSGEYAEVEKLRATGPTMTTPEFAKVIRALANFDAVPLDLGAIRVPTLVLYGENEVPFMRKQASLLAGGLPDATLREVPDGGHASNLDNPAFFSEAVREFLTKTVYGDTVTNE